MALLQEEGEWTSATTQETAAFKWETFTCESTFQASFAQLQETSVSRLPVACMLSCLWPVC